MPHPIQNPVQIQVWQTIVVIVALLGCLPSISLQAQTVDFMRDVRPVLSDNCFHCHGPDSTTRKANLRLDQFSESLTDRNVIIPRQSTASKIVLRITSNSKSERMPPPESHKQLSPEQIELVRNWIDQGAEWPPHWAYARPVRYDVPTVTDASWPLVWIDRFILKKLEANSIPPSPTASPTTLLRRVSFDLTGLPPSTELTKRFLVAPTPEAYEALVDELLNSPHFGERMAMYWLDLVRYADTVGYHGDQTQSISPYRDWVIHAFNSNMPFDQFTREQLAGDLLEGATVQQRIATGYNRLLQTSHEGGVQPKEYRAIYMADRVRNVSAVWMGATIGCAQCHDHKFDPYSAKDFYALGAFFADVDDETHLTKGDNKNPTNRHPELELPSPAEQAEIESVTARIAELKAMRESLNREKNEAPDAKTDQQMAELSAQIKKSEQELGRVKSRVVRTMITVSLKEPRVTRILPRGNWLDETGDMVVPAIPEFLGRLTVGNRRANRLDLANWLVDANEGAGLLTARVLVNRLWYLCFGSGLARNLDDFGGQGEPPVLPELLDRLAHELVSSGWDIKALLKQIILSQTYRQSSAARPDLVEIDPQNRWYARQVTFRLPAEMIRDNALAISGLLVDQIGGRSARPYQPEGYYRHLNFPTRTYRQDDNEQQWRRGLYVHWQRQFLHPMLKAFDAPSREECTAQRPQSNTPLAALTLLNDPTFLEAARSFASRMLQQDAGSPSSRIDWLFQKAVTRPATDVERQVIVELFQSRYDWFRNNEAEANQFLSVGLTPIQHDNLPTLAAWTEVARVILNLAETNTRN